MQRRNIQWSPLRIFWSILTGLSLLILILPSTSWVVIDQFHVLYDSPRTLNGLLAELGAQTPTAVVNKPWSKEAVAKAATRYPNDYTFQLGCAIAADNSQDRAWTLKALTAKFPGHASLDAIILRNAVNFDVPVARDDNKVESILAGKPLPSSLSVPPATPAALVTYDAVAVDGERLDPQNAFFPMMRAIGLYEAHQDAAAMAEMDHAATLPIWNDYLRDDSEALWAMDKMAFRKLSTISRQFGSLFSVCRCFVSSFRCIDPGSRRHGRWLWFLSNKPLWMHLVSGGQNLLSLCDGLIRAPRMHRCRRQ